MKFFVCIVPVLFTMLAFYMRRFICKAHPSWNRSWVLAILFMLLIPGMIIYTPYFIFWSYFASFLMIEHFIFMLCHKQMSFRYMVLPLLIALGLVLYGNWNVYQRVPTYYTIKTEKVESPHRYAFLSDLHYPNANNPEMLADILDEIAGQKPEAIFLGGDIIDERTSLQEIEDCFDAFAKIDQQIPVYYIYGNHDLYGISREKLNKMLEERGITVLQDEMIDTGEVTIIGRDDPRYKESMNVKDLVSGADSEDFNLMVAHEPIEGKQVSETGKVDLIIQGHTHNGQLFPLHYIQLMLPKFDQIYGLDQFGDMTSITSSGITGWGYPLRTEGISEYVVVDILPENQN